MHAATYETSALCASRNHIHVRCSLCRHPQVIYDDGDMETVRLDGKTIKFEWLPAEDVPPAGARPFHHSALPPPPPLRIVDLSEWIIQDFFSCAHTHAC